MLVNTNQELLCSARNQVLADHYNSAGHVEMQLLDQLEAEPLARRPHPYPLHQPAAWAELAARTSICQADVDRYWITLAEQAIKQLQDPQILRERVVSAWHGEAKT